jgi:predicted nucleic acid-binding protein
MMKRIKPPLLATEFAEFEFTHALNWRIFRRELLASEERAVLLAFSKDVQAGLIRIAPISAATFAHARRIARTQTRLLGTRALDVLHVASAISLRADSFWTLDKKQARLAIAVGLTIP